MTNTSIYQDITTRTGGNIYIGVVGPVRTGKSTFIKRFMEALVIPNIGDEYMRERAKDELPQSGSGRTIMTAEPKFVPEDAVQIYVSGQTACSVRMIDCVGYMVEGAMGHMEDGGERMVTTPWFDYEVPIREAAETGTRKVIAEHSTIGIVITTDGTVTDIPRESYIPAEGRVISELKALGKPFIVLLNSAEPNSERTQRLREDIEQGYGVSCMAVNCLTLDEPEITAIIKKVLYEFPVSEIGIFLPPWVDALPITHSIKTELFASIRENADSICRMSEAESKMTSMKNSGGVSSVTVKKLDPGTGAVVVVLDLPRSLFYTTLSEQSGFSVIDDGDLMSLLTSLSKVKSEYDKIEEAMNDVRTKGYGIVMPTKEELKLEEPEIVRQGGRYAVRLKASAPSIHMMMANIETEVSPAVGGERASEDIINFLLQEFEGNTSKIWESNIFGKSLNDIAGEGLVGKIKRMSEETQKKLRETLQRIVNEGSNGLICIIL